MHTKLILKVQLVQEGETSNVLQSDHLKQSVHARLVIEYQGSRSKHVAKQQIDSLPAKYVVSVHLRTAGDNRTVSVCWRTFGRELVDSSHPRITIHMTNKLLTLTKKNIIRVKQSSKRCHGLAGFFIFLGTSSVELFSLSQRKS